MSKHCTFLALSLVSKGKKDTRFLFFVMACQNRPLQALAENASKMISALVTISQGTQIDQNRIDQCDQATVEELEELDAHIGILKEGLRAKQPPLKVPSSTHLIITNIIINASQSIPPSPHAAPRHPPRFSSSFVTTFVICGFKVPINP